MTSTDAIVRFGEVCEYDKQQGTHSGLPYLGLEHIDSGSGRFELTDENHNAKSQTFRFSDKHVLYGRLRPYLKKVALPERNGRCSTEIFPILPRDGMDRRYVAYWLLSDATTDLINATCTGARMPRANMEAVLDLDIYAPSIKEQHRIVAILDEAFAGIATAMANAEKSARSARDLVTRRLGDIFLEESRAWKRMKLREVALDFGRGKSKHRPRNDPKLYGGPYPFIQTGDVRSSDHLITKYSQTYSKDGLAQSKLWPRGTLCITIAANIAETGILDFDACFPDSVIGVVADPAQTTNKFLEYMLQSVRTHLKAKGKGSAQDNINLRTFENELFPFPDLAVQSRVTKELDALVDAARDLESLYTRKLAALDELKQSLLHQAFSGQL